MNCEICFEKFDGDERYPLVMKKCGHSMCKECVDDLDKSGGDRKRFKCPNCRVIVYYTNNIDEKFSKNYSRLKVMEESDAWSMRKMTITEENNV